MAGYNRLRQMSNNAVIARCKREFPALEAAQRYGFISVESIYKHFPHSGQHHVGRLYYYDWFYNVEDYVDAMSLDEFKEFYAKICPELNLKGRKWFYEVFLSKRKKMANV